MVRVPIQGLDFSTNDTQAEAIQSLTIVPEVDPNESTIQPTTAIDSLVTINTNLFEDTPQIATVITSLITTTTVIT